MSTLYTWDVNELKWKLANNPVTVEDGQYKDSSAFKYVASKKRYVQIWGDNSYKDAHPDFVSFQNGSWKDIKKLLKSHYMGFIDIANYWNIGDTRTIHIDAIPATITSEAQPAQDIEFQIVGFNHDTLATPGSFKDKAAVSIIAKSALAEYGELNDTETEIPWVTWTRREWCNNNLYNSINEDGFRELVRKVSKNSVNYVNDGVGTTHDLFWIPSYSEIAGYKKEEGDIYTGFNDNSIQNIGNLLEREINYSLKSSCDEAELTGTVSAMTWDMLSLQNSMGTNIPFDVTYKFNKDVKSVHLYFYANKYYGASNVEIWRNTSKIRDAGWSSDWHYVSQNIFYDFNVNDISAYETLRFNVPYMVKGNLKVEILNYGISSYSTRSTYGNYSLLGESRPGVKLNGNRIKTLESTPLVVGFCI